LEKKLPVYTNDAKQLLAQVIEEKWLTARGAIGFWPATKTAPDTVIVHTENGNINLEFLRQQIKKAAGQPNMSLADFVKPGPSPTTSIPGRRFC
jgi:5-methyltetrahydrofolate--homocysteine methyltransferase